MERLKYYFKIFNINTRLVVLIMGFCIFIFLLTFLLSMIEGDVYSLSSNVLIRFGANYAPLVMNGEYWRLLSAVFLHGSILHILFNMYSLNIVGSFVENFFGKKKFVVIFVVTGILSSLTSYLLTASFSVGASGAIFGLVGLLLSQYFRRKEYWSELPIDYKSLLMVAILNISIGIVTPGIDNAAHFGGLLVGMFLGLFINHENAQEGKLKTMTINLLFFLSILLLIYTFLMFVLNIF